MQQSPASSYNYPSSPAPTHPLYDSGYSTFDYSSPTPTPTPFHFSSCPYSNDSYYNTSPSYPSYYSPIPYAMPQQAMPYMNSTPLPSSNVCQVPSTQTVPLKRRRPQQELRTSPALSSARKRISDEAIDHLNNFYAMKKRPTEAEKDQLAMECNITLAQVNTWFNNARSRRGDTNPKVAQKILRQKIDSLSNQVAFLQQQHSSSSSGHFEL